MKTASKMGALFVKAGCTECFNRDLRKISPEIICDLPVPERRLSEEIIKELKTCGIITSETATARGGLAFEIMPDGDLMAKKPRRLPALLSNRVQSGINNAKERKRAASIRRLESLDKKAKAGKEYSAKRAAVIERREKKLKDKIRRTEEKLRKHTTGVSK